MGRKNGNRGGSSSSSNANQTEMDRELRSVKRERLTQQQQQQQRRVNPRVLRSSYHNLQNTIKDQVDDLMQADSQKFDALIKQADDLHQLVQTPREQLVDAEVLLGLTNTLASSVKSQTTEGITPADFVSHLRVEFGQSSRSLDNDDDDNDELLVSLKWNEIGLAVSPIFMNCIGITTMIGPMNTQLKQRKPVVPRKRTRPTEKVHPEEVNDSGAEEKTDTDKNMAKMFEILKRSKRVRLENLILNRISFAQTVENLFALSFLVKDGRVEITMDESGSHFVSPRNAPAADSVMSGEVAYRHFVFRLDFKDWKLMLGVVPDGGELMPHREATVASQVRPEANNSQGTMPTTPIRKLSRNRGLVVQEESVVEDSPEIDGDAKATGLRRCKRRLA